MLNFLNIYTTSQILSSKKTCYKNPEKPSCVDHIQKNCQRIFQNTCVFEIRLSNFHKLTITVMKLYFPKQKPKIKCYRHYIKFRIEIFRVELDNELLYNKEYQHILNIFLKILNELWIYSTNRNNM